MFTRGKGKDDLFEYEKEGLKKKENKENQKWREEYCSTQMFIIAGLLMMKAYLKVEESLLGPRHKSVCFVFATIRHILY